MTMREGNDPDHEIDRALKQAADQGTITVPGDGTVSMRSAQISSFEQQHPLTMRKLREAESAGHTPTLKEFLTWAMEDFAQRG